MHINNLRIHTTIGEMMNYVIIAITYYLLMKLGVILMFVANDSILLLLPIFAYCFLMKFYPKVYNAFVFHAFIICLIQSFMNHLFHLSLLNIVYLYFVSIICVWMYFLRLQYQELL